jgi:CheY-like chemotaxis protein
MPKGDAMQGRHALVLEDEPIIGFALEDMLQVIGCSSVLMATRIEDALMMIDRHEVDVAVLDVNIHGQRSYPVAERLSQQGIPYVFATGYGDLEHPDRFRSVPTVSKPYSMEQIRQAIGQVLTGPDEATPDDSSTV